MFYLSRAFVPFALFRLYRKGVFQDSFSFAEVKHIFKIIIVMQAIDLAGHYLLRRITWPTVSKHVGENEMEFAFKKKKVMDDYLIQKNYFKSKKEAKKSGAGGGGASE